MDAYKKAYSKRCFIDKAKCESASTYEMFTSLPNTKCYDEKSKVCGPACGLTSDYTTSMVSVAPGSTFDVNGRWAAGPPAKVKQGVCLTLELEPEMLENNRIFASDQLLYGSQLPAQYIGLDDGVFRMFPASPQAAEKTYDPRKRPWYKVSNAHISIPPFAFRTHDH